jgi:hypothetical protein
MMDCFQTSAFNRNARPFAMNQMINIVFIADMAGASAHPLLSSTLAVCFTEIY